MVEAAIRNVSLAAYCDLWLKQDFIELLNRLDKLPMVNRAINRFSGLLSLNTWLSKTCSLRRISCIDSCNLFWGCGLFWAGGFHSSRSGVKALVERFWPNLWHSSLSSAKTKPHSINCPDVGNQLMYRSPDFFLPSLFSCFTPFFCDWLNWDGRAGKHCQ